MAVSDISEKRLKEATGMTWAEWQALFAAINAKDLSHKEITTKLSEKTNVDGWWIQMVTVKFEQEIGRRKKGQESDGTYTLGVGKVINGNMDDVYAKWLDTVETASGHNGQKIISDPKVTTSNKWRYWRAQYSDGTRAVVSIHQIKPGKAGFTVDQQKCHTESQAKRWKDYWKKYVNDTFDVAIRE